MNPSYDIIAADAFTADLWNMLSAKYPNISITELECYFNHVLNVIKGSCKPCFILAKQ